MTISELHNLADLTAAIARQLHELAAVMIKNGPNEVDVDDGAAVLNIVDLRLFTNTVEKAVIG